MDIPLDSFAFKCVALTISGVVAYLAVVKSVQLYVFPIFGLVLYVTQLSLTVSFAVLGISC